MSVLRVLDIGRCGYQAALELQLRLVERVRESDDDLACLVLVEHDPPVITLGRARGAEHVVAAPEYLKHLGIELHHATRGGDVTYHGPGQLVGYPIVRIDRRGRDVHAYFRHLEEALIRVLAGYGISAGRKEGLTGVWVGEEKAAAMGIAVKRWVSYHGFALNVCCDLSHFDTIVPCGLRDKKVTSLSALLGRHVSVEEIKPAVLACLVDVFGFDAAEPATEADL